MNDKRLPNTLKILSEVDAGLARAEAALEEAVAPVGTVHPKGTLFLQLGSGTASDPITHEETYHFGVDAATLTPILRSSKTGKVFTLSWREIVTLAEAAGVDSP